MFPDAISNVVHGYAEMDKKTDESINTILEVKSTSTKQESLVLDEDYEEDYFSHALLHNNDDHESDEKITYGMREVFLI